MAPIVSGAIPRQLGKQRIGAENADRACRAAGEVVQEEAGAKPDRRPLLKC